MSLTPNSYELPPLGKLSLNSNALLNYDEKLVHQFLESRKLSAKSVNDDLNHLMDWYAKQHHLPDDPLIKRRLFQTLFTTDWSLEKTKRKVDNFYSLKNKFPEILKMRDPWSPEIEKLLIYPQIIILPKHHMDNQRIAIFRSTGPRTYDPINIAKVLFMIADYRFYNEDLFCEHWVFDCKHLSVANVLALSSMAPKAVAIWTYAYATKVKGIHCINVPSIAEPLIALIKKLLKTKIVERFHVYSDPEDIFEVFSKSMFPTEYGGGEQSCEELSRTWADTLKSPEWREWFITQDDICANESKRLEPSCVQDLGMFGVDGSFKELSID